MKNLYRKFRGRFGLGMWGGLGGAVTGAAWWGVTSVIGNANHFFAGLAGSMGVWAAFGAFSAIGFGAVLAAIGSRTTLAKLPAFRTALVGAVAGVFAPTAFLLLIGVNVFQIETMLVSGVSGLLGAALGAGIVIAAKKADRDEIGSGPDVGQIEAGGSAPFALVVLLVGSLMGCSPAPDAAGTSGEIPPTISFEIPEWAGSAWLKGNTHAHTTESDGDSSPEVVARWYKDHGYDFLVLTDHNVFTDPARLDHLTDSTFMLIPGEEVTSGFDGKSVHVNGLNIPHVIEARRAESLVATIQANVDAIREVEAVPHINHPNFEWSFGAEELAQIEGDKLLEIHNGHPTVHNEGGGDTPGMEEVWDILLTGGKRIYGIAVDDAHHFQGEFAADRANPGRGWLGVRAGARDPVAIMTAMEAGHFYASTGVELDDLAVTANRIEVHIQQRGNFRYTTEFIGVGGVSLGQSVENPAIYDLTEDVGYVRAKVTNSMGDVAWTQPMFVEGR